MNILITGGAGFIGSHIADHLIEKKHRVIIVDNLSSGFRHNLSPQTKFYKLDIRSPRLLTTMKKEKVEIIYHCAAQMDVRRSVADPLNDADINVMGTLNLLQCAVKTKVKKIIFSSTGGAIYGEQNQYPAPENHALQPLSPYGISKLCTEKYLYFYRQTHGLDYVILRYANVYGPRQNPFGEAGVVAIFCHKLLRGEQPTINGDGKQTRDFVFVKDVAHANLLALEYSQNDIFNVGTGQETDINELFNHLNQLTGNLAQKQHGQAAEGEQRRSVLDYQKIKHYLDWEPGISIKEGLALTVDFFRKTEKRKNNTIRL